MNIHNQSYLKNKQYKTAKNLEARINLHRRFGTNLYGWTRWLFDQVEFPSKGILLEAGCGPAGLWVENQDRLPWGLSIYLCDLSIGMVKQACQALKQNRPFRFLNNDVQAIPFYDGTFELVLANHMLYHVPDLHRGVAELGRVLKPGGKLYAATNGNEHMHELRDLIRQFVPSYQGLNDQARRFSLENAAEILSNHFSYIEVRRYEENLEVTQAEPLIAYVLSMWDAFEERNPDHSQAFASFVQDYFARHERFHITKSQGLVIASRMR